MPRLAAGILLILLSAAGAVFLILPQWEEAGETRQTIAALQALHEELTTLAANRDALAAEYNTIAEDDLAKLDAIAPADAKATGVLVDFEALARRHHLTLERLEFVSGEVTSGALRAPQASRSGMIPVSMNLRGSYEDFRNFLTDLEHNLRLFDASDFTVGSTAGQSATIALRGQIYYRK